MEDQQTLKNYNDLVAKVDNMKKQEKMDLSADQDLTFAIMNLVGIEEHFIFSGAKTQKNEYYDLVNEVRQMRIQLLKRIIKDYEGEVWCISKHLLSASYRLIEVGTKQLSMGRKEDAYDMFQKAYDLYSLFWALKMKIVKPENVKKIDDTAISKDDPKPRAGFMGKLGDLVKRAIDCCLE